MAPPPPATLPLGERLKLLAQTLQFGWFVGHLTLLLAVLRYGMSYMIFNYYSTSARYSYRLAFISAAVTYGIVVYKGHFARGFGGGNIPSIALKLLADENVQYLVMAVVWLLSRQIPLALLPFSIYSVFHVATYSRTYLIPTFQSTKPSSASSPSSSSSKPAAKQSPLADRIGRFVKTYYDSSMYLVAALEISLLGRVILGALTFSKGSWVLLIIYAGFFRARYSQSSFVQGAVSHGTKRVDTALSHQSTPPVVRQAWETFKGLTAKAYYVTDVRRYLGGAAQANGAKKPQ